jgi:hypothetical protein
MAKKTHPLEGSRSWRMMAPSYFGERGAAGWPDSNGWLANGASSIMYETYIDLSGYEMEDLTLLPMEAALQDPGLYSAGRLTEPMWVMDVMSQVRLSAATLTNMLNPAINDFNNAPGMMAQDDNFNLITMGTLRIMGNSTGTTASAAALPPWIPQNVSTFGSGEPITVQKLWCYRFVFLLAAEDDPIVIPASRFLLNGVVTKESDLVYINRLRRDYELQGAVE